MKPYTDDEKDPMELTPGGMEVTPGNNNQNDIDLNESDDE